MPALSEKMRVATAIALHHPEKLYRRNRGLLKMTKQQLHDYAVKPISRKRALKKEVARRLKRKRRRR